MRRSGKDTADRGMYPVYEDAARYDPWVKAVLAVALVPPLVLGVAMLGVAPAAGRSPSPERRHLATGPRAIPGAADRGDRDGLGPS